MVRLKGSVPGSGSGDTVPAMLSPKEMVLPASGAERVREALSGRSDHPAGVAAGGGGNTHITVNHYGDNHSVTGVDQMHQDWAMNIKQQLPVATPGT